MTAQLLPCPVPWCTDPRPQVFSESRNLVYIRCNECQTTGPLEYNEADAITAWNTRANPAAEAMAKALEEARTFVIAWAAKYALDFGLGDGRHPLHQTVLDDIDAALAAYRAGAA